jgi:hypothetical protein
MPLRSKIAFLLENEAKIYDKHPKNYIICKIDLTKICIYHYCRHHDKSESIEYL